MKKKRIIKYTSRDFNSIKQDLVEYTKRYYPETYKDFNEASFGSLMLDTVSYVGDILSFYTDFQANESFLENAVEYNNILKKGREYGYKFRGNPSSVGVATLFIIVPASSTGLGPDSSLIPILLKGSTFNSNSGNGFILNENVDFSKSTNEVVVAEVDENTGVPSSYAIKSYGQIISGELVEELIEVGEFKKFRKVELSGENISEVISVIDSEGHEYFEVDYLSQDVIYKSILNRDSDRNRVQSIIKPIVVPRRYVVEQLREGTFLQFGHGTEDEIKVNSISDPSNVILNIHGKDYVTDDSYDPSKLTSTDKFGVGPSNTTLTVVYRNNTSDSVNAAVGTITEVTDPIFEFNDITNLDENRVAEIIDSLEITNEKSIIGDISLPNTDELKSRIRGTYASQNRAVTREDYINTVYRMPPQFGSIKRVNIIRDDNSFKRNLNMYVISEDENGSLIETSSTIKKNLKVWLQKNKMLNDTIDILNAKIINIGIQFEVVGESDRNKFSILSDATNKLQEYYSNHLDIGEPFLITDVYRVLNQIDGIVDTVNVEIVRKFGGLYSDIKFDIDLNTDPSGRILLVESDQILEIKYPSNDISGIIK